MPGAYFLGRGRVLFILDASGTDVDGIETDAISAHRKHIHNKLSFHNLHTNPAQFPLFCKFWKEVTLFWYFLQLFFIKIILFFLLFSFAYFDLFSVFLTFSGRLFTVSTSFSTDFVVVFYVELRNYQSLYAY